MTPLFAFILGLLIGWLIEWLIDYFYWRRRSPQREAMTVPDARPTAAAARPAPDDLKVIRGIGPVIERKLNEAGIYTFEQLGNLTTAQLRRILGNVIERLANEDALLEQARDLARRK